MQHYAGLDVSVKGTSVCIVDKAGKVIREVKVAICDRYWRDHVR
jgi:transposase